MNIYIVDDDVIFLKTVNYYLQREFKENTNLKCFTNRDSFVKQCEEKEPDMIFLDLHLSETAYWKDASELIEYIKNHYPKTQLVIVSGQKNPKVIAETIMKGANDYVVKNESTFKKLSKLIKANLFVFN